MADIQTGTQFYSVHDLDHTSDNSFSSLALPRVSRSLLIQEHSATRNASNFLRHRHASSGDGQGSGRGCKLRSTPALAGPAPPPLRLKRDSSDRRKLPGAAPRIAFRHTRYSSNMLSRAQGAASSCWHDRTAHAQNRHEP